MLMSYITVQYSHLKYVAGSLMAPRHQSVSSPSAEADANEPASYLAAAPVPSH